MTQKKEEKDKNPPEIYFEGIFWAIILGMVGVFVPGMFPLVILFGSLGPFLGAIIGAVVGYQLGKMKEIQRDEETLIREHQARVIREEN